MSVEVVILVIVSVSRPTRACLEWLSVVLLL